MCGTLLSAGVPDSCPLTSQEWPLCAPLALLSALVCPKGKFMHPTQVTLARESLGFFPTREAHMQTHRRRDTKPPSPVNPNPDTSSSFPLKMPQQRFKWAGSRSWSSSARSPAADERCRPLAGPTRPLAPGGHDGATEPVAGPRRAASNSPPAPQLANRNRFRFASLFFLRERRAGQADCGSQ